MIINRVVHHQSRVRTRTIAILLLTVSVLAIIPSGMIPKVAAAHSSTLINGKLFDKILVVMMENEGICDVLGSNISNWIPGSPCGSRRSTSAPYMTSLAQNWAFATQYNSTDYPHQAFSLKNYLGLISGQTWGCTAPNGDAGVNTPGTCTANVWNSTNSNLIDILPPQVTWKAYMENMTSNCQTTSSSTYFAHHDPFVYFSDIVNNPARCSQVVPAGANGSIDSTLFNDLNSANTPNLMWLTPNRCNDMHDVCNGTNNQTLTGASCDATTVAMCLPVGDRYLQNLVPNILASYTFTHTRAALFLTFDEGNDFCPLTQSTSQDCLYTVWIGPQAKQHYSTNHFYNHYSWLATIEANWGLDCLVANGDCAATPMSNFFRATWNVGQQNMITSSNLSTQPFTYPWDGNGFYAQGRHWIFYTNYENCGETDANCLDYATSSNDMTWIKYSIGVPTGSTPSITTNGTHVFYTRYEGVDSESGGGIIFRVGLLQGDGTISWQPEVTVTSGVANRFYYSFSMRISTTGEAFIAYQNASSSWSSGYPFVIRSNGTNYSTWQQETQLSNSRDQWRFSLAALPDGQIYVLYWPFWGTLRGRLWTSGTWGPPERVSPHDTFVQNIAFAFGGSDDAVHAIWQERATQNIRIATRNGSWSTPDTVALSETGETPRWTASFDPIQGRLYIIYYSKTSNQIYQYSGTPGYWNLKSVLWTSTGGDSSLIGSTYDAGLTTPSSSVLGVFWTQRSGSDDDVQLMFANETIILNPNN